MSQVAYPKQVKKTDLPLLTEQAKKMRTKGDRAFFGMYVLYGFIAWLISPIVLFISGEIVISSYPKPVAFTTGIQVAVIIVFFVTYMSVLLYLNLGFEYATRKVAKLKYDELVFFECILIADNLLKNDRKQAIKEVDRFTSWLHAFQSTTWYNSKAKRYKPEINLLNTGRNELKRLLLFSTDRRLPELFINFGITLVNGYDASAFSFLKTIVDKTEKYGKIESWFDKIRGGATTIQVILYSISILIGIIVSVVTISKLL